MIRLLRNRSRIALAVCAALTIFAAAVLAGPPLICWPFDIGGAKSLPFGGPNWSASDPSYNTQHLADDTLALLQPGTPIIVRMETLRRATVYTMKDRAAGATLLERVEARVNEAEKRGKPDALALFDLGYLLETYKQAYWRDTDKNIATGRDGYALIARAIQLRGSDAEMEFAAAIVRADSRSASNQRTAHFKQALAGANEGSLLAKNLVSHAELLQAKGKSLGELRAQLK
ncbi:MAG: hypothetical protein M1453_03960 [Acidobacteria bacterium]|nr:hypothetical protein [Acidobacteriota bacterium]